jgi:hypothetical protein
MVRKPWVSVSAGRQYENAAVPGGEEFSTRVASEWRLRPRSMFPTATPSVNKSLSSCKQPTAKFSKVADGESVSVSITRVPLPNTKVEFWNVKVHEPPVEHEDPQSGEPHGTLRNDDDLDGSNATSHGSPPVLEKHGLHRMLDMPLTSKNRGSCCAGVP